MTQTLRTRSRSNRNTMRNVSEVTLRFTIQMNPPLDVEPKPDWELEPNEAATIRVSFDPDYRGDRQVPHEVRDKLLVCYDDNPHVDSIDLGAELSFPNPDSATRSSTLAASSTTPQSVSTSR